MRAQLTFLVRRHGDEFVLSGMRTQQKDFEEQLSKHLMVKHLATLGQYTALGDLTKVRVLYRIVRWVEPPYHSGQNSYIIFKRRIM